MASDPGRGGPGRATATAALGHDLVDLEVGPPAHGGHCVARLDGRVVFVRHTAPGEVVRARLTESGEARRFWRADAVEIVRASPDRVPSLWPAAGPGGVGGGELAHLALPAQRRWKEAVVVETLRRIGGLDVSVEVEEASGDDARGGLGWRTRIELSVDGRGRPGMYRYRSRDILPLTTMPLAGAAIADLGLFARRWPPGARIEAIGPTGGRRGLVLVDGEPLRGDRRSVREQVAVAGLDLTYRVAGGGFWQVHDQAPRLLVDAVLRAASVGPGARVLDLYCGAGLFTVPLALVVGEGGVVHGVEADPRAARDARRNLHRSRHAVLHVDDVAAALAGPELGEREDVVVLDPPRAGAGADVMAAIAARRPARVVYVACDPAALARDLRVAAAHGYALTGLRAIDLFPHTHHVECVATLEPG